MKDKILNLSVDLFAKYGYDAVSMSDIAKELNITKAALYYHFKSKRDIYMESLQRAIDDHKKILLKALDFKGSPKERFRYFISVFLGKESEKSHERITPLIRVMSFKDQVIVDFLKGEKRKMVQLLESLLIDIKKECREERGSLDVSTLSLMLMGALNSLIFDRMMNEKVSWTIDSVADQCVKLFFSK